MTVQDYFTKWLDIWKSASQNDSSLKMLSGCLPSTKEEILESSSMSWGSAGIMSHGEYLTVNILDSPKDAKECLLSDILETQNILPKYYLSPRAATGILRRAAQIPELIQQILEKLAVQYQEP